ncbi:alpha/beta-hydrolase [Cucurbitaria berberidis CBS 394.84]|uniref:Alpha/beta-hydrolase n=1 Tax=Cucurbitaria berberidis CBS 394.84 TaxID=1168544 RepID=A0A9P4LB70_9PLEO|nr:alpha/beta-hydrolase [Cucurbitaria berberidis CBS 394.84]KAF1847909.1 alpha/beta-hydrolase [Cucurbitaria berberidis CBS 394.84]
MANHSDSKGASIQVIHRDERSFFMSVVQFVVRSLRKPLSNREVKHESGSIKLTLSKAKLQMRAISERIVCDIHIYDYFPLEKPTKDPKKRIYYFAGGSWQTPPSGQHFRICAKMAKAMPDTIVSVVSMPLAPNNPAPESFPMCLKLYRALMAQADEAGERVILAGDSSGSNIILAMTLEALREDDDQAQVDVKHSPHPTAIMAICPSTDLTRDNPEIWKIAPRDPLLTPDIIKGTAKAWCGDWDPTDRRVSPINNDISLFARKGINVHGITAGCDVLSPDGILFRDRCAKEGVKGQWAHWENQMHCFILTMPFGLPEAEEAVQWIIDVLNKE